MTIKTYFATFFSLFFLFILIAPTLVLINSNEEAKTVVFSLDNEKKRTLKMLRNFLSLLLTKHIPKTGDY